MKYQIIYSDPPWPFKTYSEKGKGRSPEKHYKCMSMDDIKKLPVGNIADDNCALFLWPVFPHLEHALEVIKAWGFTYKTVAFVWVKTNRKTMGFHWGCGYWTRANAEIVLLATKGKPKRLSAGVHQVIMEPVGKHSVKPRIVRKKIVKLMGNLSRIELFAREKEEGWVSIGLDIDGKDIRDVLGGGKT